ncbi:tetratricopeptide repeat protein [Chloroflexota bacterium]
MEKKQEFGTRLRELRTTAGLSLRELAERVGVNFTYLSKIENGALPPPSEKVIRQLAESLKANKDELLILAGIIPRDITAILKEGDTLKKLRAERAKKEAKALANTKAHKSLFRVATATVVTILVAILLWLALPTTDNAIAANNEGLALNNSEEYEKALVAFNKAIELDPNLAMAYNNRGWAYIELGQHGQAIDDCNKAIELDPDLALAYSNRGLAYIRLGQYEQAVTDCSQAIELDPDLALAYSNRGLAYIELGQYEEAIADLDRAMELDSTFQ